MAIFWGSPEARTHMGTAAERDTVDYTDSNAAIFIEVLRPPAGGYAEGDRLVSIENVWGSRFDDTIEGRILFPSSGSPGPVGLYGYHGNDKLTGAGANDTLHGEDGNDTLDGGAGNDGVFGDRGADRVAGGDGEDIVWGGKGVDTLLGGPGRDFLEGGADADMIYGDPVRFDQPGGGGRILGPSEDSDGDVAAYTRSNAAVIVDLSGKHQGGAYSSVTQVSDGSASGTTPRVALTARAGGHAAGDVLFGINHLRGSTHNDVLVGDDAINVLAGNQGNDALWGGGGGDFFWGGKGADILIGGAGFDWLEGGGGADTVYGDTVRTNAAGEIIGPGVNERAPLVVDHASYTLSNTGVIVDLSGKYQGGAYSSVTQVSDGSASGTTPRVALTTRAGGHAAGDVLYGISGVFGSQHGDVLIGDDGDNYLNGDQGNDTLWGGGGDDLFVGRDGTDILIGGPGRDHFDGGAGADTIYGGSVRTNTDGAIVGPGPEEDRSSNTASYQTSNAGVIVDLSGAHQGGAYSSVTQVSDGSGGTTPRVQLTARAGGHAAGDVLYGVDKVQGSAHGDVLIGDDRDNLLWGHAGNDTLLGGAGKDELDGFGGNDSLVGGAGDDRLTGRIGHDTLTGGAGSDWFWFTSQQQGQSLKTAITDFEAGERIILNGLNVTAAQLQTLLSTQGQAVGGKVTIDFGSDRILEVTLTGGLTELTANDFVI